MTADGNFMFRTIYSLVGQQGGEHRTDGEFLPATTARSWPMPLGVLAELDDGRAAIDLHRLSGDRRAVHQRSKSPFMINGVWEVPDDDRPQRAG